jgi:hypothetical protein
MLVREQLDSFRTMLDIANVTSVAVRTVTANYPLSDLTTFYLR